MIYGRNGADARPRCDWPGAAVVLGVVAAEVGLVLAGVQVVTVSALIAGATATGVAGYRLLSAGPLPRFVRAPQVNPAQQLPGGGAVVPFNRGENAGDGAP